MRGIATTLAALLCVLAAAPGGAAEEPDAAACLACHGVADFAAEDGRKLAVDPKKFEASTHAALGCTVCHADATEIPHAEHLAPVTLDTCAACHDQEVGAFRESGHGKARAAGAKEAPGCADCHGDVHAITPATEPTSAAYWANLEKTCARCHADVSLGEKFHLPVVRPVDAYLKSVHARAVAAGRRAAVCSDCHGTHLILPASDPRSSIWRPKVAETCGACHQDILAAFRDSVHGLAVARGVRDAPTCTDCHGEHDILPPEAPGSPVSAANLPTMTCGRCHGNLRLDARYGLPTEVVATFRDSFHGLALRGGRTAVANCASCHGVHDIRPSSDPRSHVNPANLPATCGQCHPGAGTRFAIGKVHVGPEASPTRLEYWIRLVYLALIPLVIGFMALHDALDLARKARRTEPLPSLPPDAVPVRMPRLLRWQHGLVMLSFPLLVWSGFALTYPESWWGAPLRAWAGDLRGIVHRAAAVMMIVALAWHVGHLAASRRLRGHLRGLNWSRRDWRYFRAMLAYYLARRPTRPHGGKFTYVEKAEYWAFLWGMLVMTVTGLLLWFADTTLRYLPKWTADAATALHFYEAVLATLAILVWHLYWVIFDPDVYPMDWSWWDGRPPATRVLERGPEPESAPPAPETAPDTEPRG